MRMRGLAGVVALLCLAADAQAAPSPVALDDAAPALNATDGGWTTSLGFTNLTSAAVMITARPPAGCTLVFGESPAQPSVQLPAAQHSEVKVTAGSPCVSAEKSLDFTVTAVAMVFRITAKAHAKAPPDWNQLWAFGIALGALALWSLLLWAYWSRNTTGARFWAPLPYLGDSWNFKESWVSNVTVGGSVLTGVLGSSNVVTAFLGANGDAAVALATVGAAIAAALVGAGAIVLLACKTREGEFTVGGILLASATTLAGALGELWTVYRSGKHLPLGDVAHGLLAITLVAMALLLIYGVRSLLAILDAGTTKPASDPLALPLPEPLLAASMIVEALKHEGDPVAIDAAIQELREATTEPELTALRANETVSNEPLEVFVARLQLVQPLLQTHEIAHDVGRLVAGDQPRISLNRADTMLRRYRAEQVDPAIDALEQVHPNIHKQEARRAVGQMLARKPGRQRPSRPRAALL